MPTANLADIQESAPVAQPGDMNQFINKTAQKYNLDPQMFGRLISAESNGNPNALSSKGAMGMAQLMPTTASAMGVNNPQDPYQNIEGGAKYLSQQMARFGDPRSALAAYNWGPENVAKGGNWPKETIDYVNKVAGPPKNSFANISDIAETPGVPTSPNISIPRFKNDMIDLGNTLNSVGRWLRPHAPDILGMTVGGLIGGPPGILAGAAAATVARSAEQAGLVQSGQTSPEVAAHNVRNTAISNLAGGFAGQALSEITPAIAKWTMAKLAGVAPDNISGMQAVNDMVERSIPAGLGFSRKVMNLKAVENEGLDGIYAKYRGGGPAPTTPGLVKAGAPPMTAPASTINKSDLYGDIAQYYIHNTNAPRSEIEAALGKDGYNLIEKVRHGITLTPQELTNAVSNSEKNNAWGDFLGRKDGDITFDDARIIKQNLQSKVPFGQEMEGSQQARAIVSHHIVENIAKNIPDATDRAAFLAHNAELEKLIKIQELPGMSHVNRRMIAGQVAMPLAGGVVGFGSGYYSHQDPMAAAGRGALAGALMGPTLPSLAARMVNSPTFQSLATLPMRTSFPPQVPAGGPAIDNATRQRIVDFLRQEDMSNASR